MQGGIKSIRIVVGKSPEGARGVEEGGKCMYQVRAYDSLYIAWDILLCRWEGKREHLAVERDRFGDACGVIQKDDGLICVAQEVKSSPILRVHKSSAEIWRAATEHIPVRAR